MDAAAVAAKIVEVVAEGVVEVDATVAEKIVEVVVEEVVEVDQQ